MNFKAFFSEMNPIKNIMRNNTDIKIIKKGSYGDPNTDRIGSVISGKMAEGLTRSEAEKEVISECKIQNNYWKKELGLGLPESGAVSSLFCGDNDLSKSSSIIRRPSNDNGSSKNQEPAKKHHQKKLPITEEELAILKRALGK